MRSMLFGVALGVVSCGNAVQPTKVVTVELTAPAAPTRSPRESARRPPELVARMTRTPGCLVRTPSRAGGPCPTYTVSVFADGTVVWKGDWDVRVHAATARLDRAHLDALRSAFRDVAFFTLLETYDCSEKAPAGVRVCSSDEATATLTFRDESRQKTVFHDHGDGVAPPLLDALEKGVDEIIDTARWIH